MDDLDQLVRDLAHDNADVRRSAAWSLARVGDARAVEPLCRALADKDEVVRDSAAAALVKLGPVAVEPLCRALAHRRLCVRRSAAKTLGRFGDVQSLPLIVLTSSSLTPLQRFHTLEAMRQVNFEHGARVLRFPLPGIEAFCR